MDAKWLRVDAQGELLQWAQQHPVLLFVVLVLGLAWASYIIK